MEISRYEEANPNPEYLIKSIAEQGYSLETALADLIDNSISASANKIEILLDIDQEPFTLFLADNGKGMDLEALKKSMQFPSDSPEKQRNISDLGRFGLGMKTASFSQTRKFTVISKEKGTNKYSARTWDVAVLTKTKEWKMIVNTQKEIEELINIYKRLSDNYLSSFDEFEATTIIIWQGLYKFEKYLEDNKKESVKNELMQITVNYLSLVFHRFLERQNNPLQIRINNKEIPPFNPFPTQEIDFRPIEYKQRKFSEDFIKIEGFVLPARSIDDCEKGINCWTLKNKSLMDMEGIYIYRADRIILFGGWYGLLKKTSRLQLARVRVDVGNKVDHLLHLNVAKSKVVIPHNLKDAFEKYAEQLKVEAEREYYNRGIKAFSEGVKKEKKTLLNKKITNKGVLLEINKEYPVLSELIKGLNREQLSNLKVLIRMINSTINKIRQVHEDLDLFEVKEEDLSLSDMVSCVRSLKKDGLYTEQLQKDIIEMLGIKNESLPEELINFGD